MEAGLPDYPEDLNAMYHAASILKGSDRLRYEKLTKEEFSVYKLKHGVELPYLFYADAQAKAFLKTLNLWTDD